MGADFNLKPSLSDSRQTSRGSASANGERDETAFVAAERDTEDARDERRALRAIDGDLLVGRRAGEEEDGEAKENLDPELLPSQEEGQQRREGG